MKDRRILVWSAGTWLKEKLVNEGDRHFWTVLESCDLEFYCRL